MELLRLAPEEVFPSLSYAPPPASPGAPAWVHAVAARRDQARPACGSYPSQCSGHVRASSRPAHDRATPVHRDSIAPRVCEMQPDLSWVGMPLYPLSAMRLPFSLTVQP